MCMALLGGAGIAEDSKTGTCGGGSSEEEIRQLVVESETSAT